MNHFIAMAAACAISLWTINTTTAQQAVPPYGTPITLEQTKKVLAAAEAEAQKNNWPVVITVVDTGAHVMAVHRLDNTQIGSIAIAEGKARSAVLFRRPTKALEDALGAGGVNLRILTYPGAMPLDGGFPIFVDGKIIGGVGVSGVTPTQDAQIASAGANALK